MTAYLIILVVFCILGILVIGLYAATLRLRIDSQGSVRDGVLWISAGLFGRYDWFTWKINLSKEPPFFRFYTKSGKELTKRKEKKKDENLFSNLLKNCWPYFRLERLHFRGTVCVLGDAAATAIVASVTETMLFTLLTPRVHVRRREDFAIHVRPVFAMQGLWDLHFDCIIAVPIRHIIGKL